jgi:ABC-2 type transport system permease protein
MRKIWAIAVKEMRQIGRDPLFLLMLLGLPAFMLVVFGFAVNFDVWDLPLTVEDRDLTPASRELQAAFFNSGRFARAAAPADPGDFHRLFQNGGARAALIIPETFGTDLAAGRSAPVQFLFDGTDANTANTAIGYANALLQTWNAERLARALREAGGDTVIDALITVEPRVWYNPELRSSHFLVPGLIGFILMITAVLSTALSVVREKERGTMEQLGVAPLGTVQILVGKTLPYLVISLAATAIILASARLLFGVAVRGSYLDLFLATVLYLLGGFCMGLLISTIARTQAVAFQMGILVSMLPTLLLSGFVFPIRNMPLFLQALSHLVPARFFLEILRGIMLKGTTLAPYWPQVGALALLTLAMLAMASLRFARKGV